MASGGYAQRTYKRAPRLAFGGTSVSVQLSSVGSVPLSEALEFGNTAEWDIIDARYVDQTLGALVVKLNEERTGFDTRQAGHQLRTKFKNLLAAEPDKRLILDWSGIPLISSSFADEAVGRLFLEMGPTLFMTRVQHIHMDPLVRSLIDRAIIQRAGQAEP
jgi:hypothetical protein